MPFNPETAKVAGQKSKRGPSKLLDPNIKEKMEILYEGFFGSFNYASGRSLYV
tara:strand:+ start:307 stop:465 length:159 start_codon:yes stop_codon:yes gene_type:complete